MIRHLIFYIDKDDNIVGTNWTNGKLTRTVQYQQHQIKTTFGTHDPTSYILYRQRRQHWGNKLDKWEID